MKLAKIAEVDNVKGLKIIIDGENEPTRKPYTYLASYVPSVGDRVLVEDVGSSYVILGKVISNYDQCGKANSCSKSDASAAIIWGKNKIEFAPASDYLTSKNLLYRFNGGQWIVISHN